MRGRRSVGGVTWWDRCLADLNRPEVPTGREELGFLVGSATVIVAVAQVTDPGTAVDLLLLSPAVAAFVLRGLVPWLLAEVFALVVVLSVAAAVGRDGNLEGAFFLVVMAVLYASWFLSSQLRALAVLAVAAATPYVVAHVLVPDEGIGWTAWTSACIFIYALGSTLRKQRLLIEQLRDAREALAEQAVAEERRRIARELHDLAGHTLAAVLLHVTGARHVLRRDVDDAERALLEAEAVGRSSLDQIRATVAALRTDERGTDPALAGSADLLPLVEEYRRAGVAITAAIAPEIAAIEGPAGTALHRIAREALANVARHAPGNDVRMAIDLGPATVTLVVTDHGQPARPAATGAGHFGLVGMGERARALGGELLAGPTADGWRVEARLPLVPTPAPSEVVR
jgi:signal transduction histidine kinase